MLIGGAAVAGADDAVLAEADARRTVAAAHPAGCSCCVPRSAAAAALTGLFLARARGEVPFFRRVVAAMDSGEGADAIRAALRDDPFVSARFRLDGP